MKEDIRETLPVAGNFYNIILSLYQKKETANILYDNNGLTRANGNITQLGEENRCTYFVLDNRVQINITSIVAVNGIFADDYSEC